MNSSTVKLFDEDNNITENFTETVELVLMGVHGDKYYDTDEELQDTRLLQTVSEEEVKEEEPKKKKEKNKVTILDFVPVLFFMLMTVLLCVGGYMFLDKFDLTSIIGG